MTRQLSEAKKREDVYKIAPGFVHEERQDSWECKTKSQLSKNCLEDRLDLPKGVRKPLESPTPWRLLISANSASVEWLEPVNAGQKHFLYMQSYSSRRNQVEKVSGRASAFSHLDRHDRKRQAKHMNPSIQIGDDSEDDVDLLLWPPPSSPTEFSFVTPTEMLY